MKKKNIFFKKEIIRSYFGTLVKMLCLIFLPITNLNGDDILCRSLCVLAEIYAIRALSDLSYEGVSRYGIWLHNVKLISA